MDPPLRHFKTENEYRQYYEATYCRAIIHTFDGYRVYFPRATFDHAFFESVNRQARDKSQFSWSRAERIDWIKAALFDPSAELYVGWLRDKKRHDANRRITLVYENYVVVLLLNRNKETATFITAYVADGTTIAKIRSGPRWR